jgi:murein L,D-transpeptidase YafK
MLSAIVASAQKSKIVINKSPLALYVIDNQDAIFVAPICAGKNLGNKERVGDCKTPEGEFMISQIQNYVYVGMNVLILPDKTPSYSAEILNQKITSLLCL